MLNGIWSKRFFYCIESLVKLAEVLITARKSVEFFEDDNLYIII